MTGAPTSLSVEPFRYTPPAAPAPRAGVLRRGLGRLFARVALFPDRHDYLESPGGGDVLPSVLVPAQGEDVEVSVAAGRTLRGIAFRRLDATATTSPLVVFLPGNSGNLSSHWLYVELLLRAGCAVFAVDYAGFGRSDGPANLACMLADADVTCDAALAWARARDLEVERLGMLGLSLGSNVAVELAGSRDDLAGVVVEGLSIQREVIAGISVDGLSGPRRLREVRDAEGVDYPRDGFRFPGLRFPAPLARRFARLAEWSYPFEPRDPVALAARVRETPLLAVHGTSDRLFPFEAALDVFRAWGGPASLWLAPGVGHAQEPALRVDTEYVAQLERFFHDGTIENDGVVVEGAAGETPRVRCQREGAYLLGRERGATLEMARVWLQEGDREPLPWPGGGGVLDGPRCVFARRMREAERQGDTWRARPSARAELYASRFGSTLAALSATLHDRDAEKAASLLREFAADNVPYPFGYLARLHCARLETVARRRAPALVATARELFAGFDPRGAAP